MKACTMEERLLGYLDQLFSAPREAFVEARKKLVAELRARGQKDDAKIIASTQKPSTTAWAINHVATHHGEALANFLGAASRLRGAQTDALRGGDAPAFRGVNRELTARIAEIVELAKAALAESGGEANVGQLRRISQSLQATPFASAEELTRLARGHLVKDLEGPSDFEMFAGAMPARAVAKEVPPPPPKKVEPPPVRAPPAPERDPHAEREARKAKEAKKAEAARAQKRALVEEAKTEAVELDAVATVAEKRAAEARRLADKAAAHVRRLERS